MASKYYLALMCPLMYAVNGVSFKSTIFKSMLMEVY